ncbi:flagellar hook-associated protein FlgL [Cellulomonas sp. URHE0023]|uniref:flagellar hook-associated protein FlgL n=1 Tax=Cellulomonas sp. URHE0023 TaxID=1380354 RepID=UPI000B00833D|nr:flagellar hook-associated protein FlgL [Cellulomonas sp. URHE0023]
MTQQTVQRQTLSNLQGNLSAMAALQGQMSSGKKINAPSDDPAAASDLLRLRGEQRTIAQQGRNAADGASWLSTIDTAMQGSLEQLRRVRDLTVQGGNGALNQVARDALATEIDGLRDAMLQQANTTYVGRSVFAGTSNAGVAFASDKTTSPPSYTFTGSPTAMPVERRIGETATVRVDSDGAAVFGDGPGSVFALLDQVSATLRAGGNPTTHLKAIDTRMDAILTEVSSVGARHNQVLGATSTLASKDLDVKSLISGVEDIDIAKTIMELQMQQVAYQGALGAAAKVIQPSLSDFLR